MIKLLKIPNSISRRVLYSETMDYLKEVKSDNTLLPMTVLDIDFGIEGIEYFHIYRDNQKIGFVTGFPQDEYWVASRVWLEGRKKIYFKEMIDVLFRLKSSQGYRGVITHPDKYTASIYTKHNIAKEIK